MTKWAFEETPAILKKLDVWYNKNQDKLISVKFTAKELCILQAIVLAHNTMLTDEDLVITRKSDAGKETS